MRPADPSLAREVEAPGQLGLEATPGADVAEMVEAFREAQRALRDDRALRLNLGDSYAANRSYQAPDSKHSREVDALPSAWREAWVERASIREYLGGMARTDAERAALDDVLRMMARGPTHGR